MPGAVRLQVTAVGCLRRRGSCRPDRLAAQPVGTLVVALPSGIGSLFNAWSQEARCRDSELCSCVPSRGHLVHGPALKFETPTAASRAPQPLLKNSNRFRPPLDIIITTHCVSARVKSNGNPARLSTSQLGGHQAGLTAGRGNGS